MSNFRTIVALITILAVLCCAQSTHSIVQLCIDPGHGCSNPENLDSCKSGTETHIEDFHEKDINLKVALALKDTLEEHGFFDVLYTRLSDVHIENLHRANLANDSAAGAFVSIHHSASTDTNTVQGSETWYCPISTVQCGGDYYGQTRNASDTLARKVVSRLVKEFGYKNRGHKDSTFTVLACSKMVSTLSEASFVNDGYFDDEADLFHDSAQAHTGEEAKAIYDGWRSYVTGQGFGNIRYEYQNMGLNDTLQVAVTLGDEFGDDSKTYDLPYEENWLLNEHVILQALSFQKDGYDYYLHHWEQRDYDSDTLIYRYPDNQNPISFWVNWDDDGIHWYTAYFYGGPFAEDLQLVTPLPSQITMIPGDTIEVFWFAPQGFNSSCSVYVDLTTNGGSTWQRQLGPVPYDHNELFSRDGGNFKWGVPYIGSNNCKLRLTAFDAVGNFAADTSHTFAIDCEAPQLSYTVDTLSSCGYNLCLRFDNYSTPNNVPTLIYWEDGSSDLLTTNAWVIKNFSNY